MKASCICCQTTTEWIPSVTIPGYICCTLCAHQRPIKPPASGGMVNESPSFEESHKENALDRFKLSLINDQSRPSLLDIGCGAGRFLDQARGRCHRAIGVEITDSARNYARSSRKLEVYKSLDEVSGAFDLITLWHVLEHIPDSEMPALCAHLQRLSTKETILVISVPNGSAWLHRWCKEQDPFVDTDSHTQHFSDTSLDRLLAHFGWQRVNSLYSSAYSIFGWLQGLTNLAISPRNFLYRYLKRGEKFSISPGSYYLRLLGSGFCCAVSLPLTVVMQLAERCCPTRAAVQTKTFRRR